MAKEDRAKSYIENMDNVLSHNKRDETASQTSKNTTHPRHHDHRISLRLHNPPTTKATRPNDGPGTQWNEIQPRPTDVWDPRTSETDMLIDSL